MAGVRVQQREQTRQALITQARRLFADAGYGAVGLAEIVAAAGVTKGALYHQFAGKEELFAAVLEQVQAEVAEAVARAADREDGGWEQLRAGCHAFLAAGTDPRIARIMLMDGPAVLGWARWREIDEGASAQLLAGALSALAEAGELPDRPVDALTRLLSGAMNEAAMWLARPGAEPGDLDAAQAALSDLLDGLRPR
jgi:AcrR family transcriptional regulator